MRTPVSGPSSPAVSRADSPRGQPAKAVPTPAAAAALRSRPTGSQSPTKRSNLAPPTVVTRPTTTRPRTGTADSTPPTPVTATGRLRLAESKRVSSPESIPPSPSQHTSSPPLPAINFNQPESERPSSSLAKEAVSCIPSFNPICSTINTSPEHWNSFFRGRGHRIYTAHS